MFRIVLLLVFLVQCLSAGFPPEYGMRGMVVAHDQEACDAGIEILQAGGNAIDAAVAVSYALAVTHPQAGNIGGGGFMVIRMADGTVSAIDYREMAPKAAERTMFQDDSGQVIPGLSRTGGLAVGVPGTVAGMQMALDRYGTLSRKQVMKPAIKLAKKGFDLPFDLAYAFGWFRQAAADFPPTQATFTNNGELYEPGERFRQPELAATLKRISRSGNAGFYEGPVAEAIVNSVQKYGGVMSLMDLQTYQAVERAPVVGQYRGYEIISMPPPSSGGIALISMLNMLEPIDFDSVEWHSAQHIHPVVEAERRAYADRSVWLGDPDHVQVPVGEMLSNAYAKQRFTDYDPEEATSSAELEPISDSLMQALSTESEETTHFSVVDRWGNAVSVTTTLNWSFGSYVMAEGAGFLLNNEMDDFSAKPGEPNSFGLLGAEANAIAPGKRMLSSMTPTIVARNDSLVMIVGTPGGATIITTVLQIVQNVIDFKMPLVDAVYAPRFHHQWLPDVIYVERNSISRETRKVLGEMGHQFQGRGGIGEVNAIIWDPIFEGWIGVPDYRLSSHARGY